MKLILTFLVLICSSCLQQHSKLPPSDLSVVVQEDTDLKQEIDNPQLAGLEEYVKGTTLIAVITDIRVETKKSETEDEHRISARVTELLKGTADKNIKFEMVTESEEAVLFDETTIICLCEKEGAWYWAGAGSVFPAEDIFIAKAKEIALATDKAVSPVFCE